ncbi:MAG: GlsB/YeaQ/YmgE family stress response membrane protein [Lachnospiraceae bacterium]|nr:GlsB/YeaQ/YmgE family stress response membrane protein [Lachnospiraceae bacterium]
MKSTKETFEYTYSADKQDELERIRKKYMPKEEDKMELLRKLDGSVTRPGMIASIALGVIGCLVFGLGMSCALVWGDTLFIMGIVLGIIGAVAMGAALPVYNKITARERERLAPQILALLDELSK